MNAGCSVDLAIILDAKVCISGMNKTNHAKNIVLNFYIIKITVHENMLGCLFSRHKKMMLL